MTGKNDSDTSADGLQALADQAPADPDASSPSSKQKDRGALPSLGPVDVPRYLDHYGVPWNVKTEGNRRFYRLDHCLFNPQHGKNEAAIVQDDSGTITYWCFHDSCQGYKWEDARREISGEDSLAQFCEGYDPNFKQGRGRKRKPAVTTEEAAQAAGMDPGALDKAFFEVTPRGKITVNTAVLADCLEEEFSPLLFEGADFGNRFYRYNDDTGTWCFFPEAEIRRRCREELGNIAAPRLIYETIQLLKDQTYLSPDESAPAPFMLNLQNGMLDLKTMELTAHEPKYYSRVQLPVCKSDDDAEPKRFIEALMQIFKDDFDKIHVIQQFYGYCLYPEVLFPCCLFQIGEGGNGKGTVQDVLCAMVGEENVSFIPLDRMQDRFGPIELKDKLLNTCSETNEKPLDITQFKAITSGDWIQAEVKYKEDVRFRPVAKHMISMNGFPNIRETTFSLMRRIIVLEYKQKFGGDDGLPKINKIADTFIKDPGEMARIFNWALEGLQSVLEAQEIAIPECCNASLERFKAKINPLEAFADEALYFGPDARIAPPDLFELYRTWQQSSGGKTRTKKWFYEQILMHFPTIRRLRPNIDSNEQSSRFMFVGVCGLAGTQWCDGVPSESLKSYDQIG